MDISRVVSSVFPQPVSDLNQLSSGVSDEAVTQLIGAAFARTPLIGEELRDARLVAFVLDVDSGRYAGNRIDEIARISLMGVAGSRVRSISGLSAHRVQRAVARLMEAGVIERLSEGPAGWLQFSPEVIRSTGINQYVDWMEVLGILAGHGPTISVLRAALELMNAPWEWSRLTYESLAVRACYSIGMAQRGILQLVQFGVLERAAHAGRGHDYRLSAWAVGRAPVPRTEDAAALQQQDGPSSQLADTRAAGISATPVAGNVAGSNATSTMAVEIGGLVVRVPVGTEIHMTIGPDGEPCYQVGPDLKIVRRA